MNAPVVSVTYYLEILSSWCHWAEPTWTELRRRYAPAAVAFDWKVALMPREAFPVSREQTEWFYRRSGTIMRSPYRLNSGWFDAKRQGDYNVPNLVAEAARDLLPAGDERVRLALTAAAVREGRRVGDWEIACDVAANAAGLDPTVLRQTAESPAVRARVEASTAAFHAHQISQRPAFVLESSIGDKAVFSGVVRVEALAATIDALLADAAAYASHAAHFGDPPVS